MAQERFWNWRDDDLTARINSWLLGIHESGLYRGFDMGASVGTTLNLVQGPTAYTKTDVDGSTRRVGLFVTPQGVLVTEDSTISLTIPANTFAVDKKYLIIAEHEYKEVEGGIEAVYRVIEGADDGLIPEVPSPSIYTVLGILTMPANTNSVAASTYAKAHVPDYAGLGDRYVRRDNPIFEGEVQVNGNRIKNLGYPDVENLSDAANLQYVRDRITAAKEPNASTTRRGVVELATQSETNSGTADRVVTADTLEARRASVILAGILRMASTSEVVNGLSDTLGVSPKTLLEALNLLSYVRDPNYVHTDQNFTAAEKEKLSEIESGAQVNRPINWVDILGRPRVPTDTTYNTTNNQLSLWEGNTRLDTTFLPISSPNEDIIAQCFVLRRNTDGSLASYDVESGNFPLGFSFGHNVQSVIPNSGNNESRFRIFFQNAVPENDFQVTLEVYDVSPNTFDGISNSTVTWAVNQTDRGFVDISLNEWTGGFQRAKFLVTCRRLRRYLS